MSSAPAAAAAGAGFKAKRINNVEVKPIEQKGGAAKKPAKGAELFTEPYANICCLAKKKSGKTTVVKAIIEKCATKGTKVLVFCASFNKDKNWKAITEWCDDHEVEIEGFESLKDEHGTDILGERLWEFKQSDKKEEKKKHKPEPEKVYVEMDDVDVGYMRVPGAAAAAAAPAEPEKKKKQSKYAPLEWIIIFDDVGGEIRAKSVNELLKTNRHWKSKVIVSTQYVTDLEPAARRQFDYWLLFPKLSLKNLEMVRESAGLPLEEEQFVDLYHAGTPAPYNFLYVDTNELEYRRKFNVQLMPPEDEKSHDAAEAGTEGQSDKKSAKQ